jgi:hypothetical protein
MDQININKYNIIKEELNKFLTSPQQNNINPPHQTKQTKQRIDQMLNSIGSSRPIKTFKNFKSKTKFKKIMQN